MNNALQRLLRWITRPWRKGVLADWEIEELCQGETPMIEPYLPATKVQRFAQGDSFVAQWGERKVISYGVTSFGYDIRLSGKELKVFTNIHSTVVDPRKMDPEAYTAPEIRWDEEDDAPYVLLPPDTGMLGHTVEYFRIPDNIVGICQGKSTYARALVSVIVTPLEPGWHGQLVVEIVNHTSSPVRIYIDQGISQVNFHRGRRPRITYADRQGKYQGQRGTQDAKV